MGKAGAAQHVALSVTGQAGKSGRGQNLQPQNRFRRHHRQLTSSASSTVRIFSLRRFQAMTVRLRLAREVR